MPEPLTHEYMRTTQRIVAAVPPGPWEPIPNEYGAEPEGVGPISFLETGSDDQVPVITFISHAREALPRYLGEVSRQAQQIRVLEARVRQLEHAKGGDCRGR